MFIKQRVLPKFAVDGGQVSLVFKQEMKLTHYLVLG